MPRWVFRLQARYEWAGIQVIRLASVIAGEDYLVTGRTLGGLDLDGVNG